MVLVLKFSFVFSITSLTVPLLSQKMEVPYTIFLIRTRKTCKQLLVACVPACMRVCVSVGEACQVIL